MLIPSDYPLPNLYYFTDKNLLKLRRETYKLASTLKKSGFEECHFPFLIPKSVLSYYGKVTHSNSFIRAYSGKDKSSYAYLKPDGIFSQGITLAGKMIGSYKDLPLLLFEISPSYARKKERKESLPFSPEESFSIQGGVFTEKNSNNFWEKWISQLLKERSINFRVNRTHHGLIEYVSQIDNEETIVAKLFNFSQKVTKRANIYFFNKRGVATFPYMNTFSLSQNISLIRLSKKRGK